MYDQRQHIELFNSPGDHLFRGTLPSEVFRAPYQGPGVTPTSVDPIVATLFACRFRMEGPAIVLFARKRDFAKMLDGPNLVAFACELAVNIELIPEEFERRCYSRISIERSLEVIQALGYSVPSRLPDLGALTSAVVNSPRMPMDDIERYVAMCRQSPNDG